MPLAALIQFIPMAAEAIELLLNRLFNNGGTCDYQLLISENNRLHEQLEHNSNEHQRRYDTLAARNQQLIKENADKERKVMNDASIAQIQQFLEPIETNDEESNQSNYAISAQNEQLFEQTAEKKDVHVIQNVEIPSNENDLEATTAQLAVENIELEKQLDHYQKQHEDELKEMEKLLAQLKAKKLNSFEDIEKQDKQAKAVLIRLAKQAKPIGMEGNNVAFFGLTATGKSTILNKLYGRNVAETGIGETTGQITSYKTKDFILWDIPGKNDEVSYMSMEYISFLKGLTRRLVLVIHTLKENSGMMKFMDAIGLDYDIVVNKMDQYEEEDRSKFCATIQEEKETIGLKGVRRMFFVSAKFPQQFPDWLNMVNYLTNPPQ